MYRVVPLPNDFSYQKFRTPFDFIEDLRVVKDDLFPIPPLFAAIQRMSNTGWSEMYKVFNMGHRMELYVPADRAAEIIDISISFGIDAKVIGRVEGAPSKEVVRRRLLADRLPVLTSPPALTALAAVALFLVALTSAVTTRVARRLPARPRLHLRHHVALPLDPLPSREEATEAFRALG